MKIQFFLPAILSAYISFASASNPPLRFIVENSIFKLTEIPPATQDYAEDGIYGSLSLRTQSHKFPGLTAWKNAGFHIALNIFDETLDYNSDGIYDTRKNTTRIGYMSRSIGIAGTETPSKVEMNAFRQLDNELNTLAKNPEFMKKLKDYFLVEDVVIQLFRTLPPDQKKNAIYPPQRTILPSAMIWNIGPNESGRYLRNVLSLEFELTSNEVCSPVLASDLAKDVLSFKKPL